MIPKIIHYCWFGGNPMPEEYKKYIESWKKFCPDYEIKRWDETNFDLNACAFVKEAYDAKKWAFVSDFARLKIIYDEGGIYLDTDVELIKNLDSFLDNKCFLAEETSGYIATGLGFGAEKENPVIKSMLSQYNGHFLLKDGEFDTLPCPRKNTDPIVKLGYKYSGKDIWKSEHATVYPPRYFCPMDYETGKTVLTEDTVSIHHYSAAWHNWAENKILKISRYCLNRFGQEKGKRMANVIEFPFRIINKVEKCGLIKAAEFTLHKFMNNK